MPTAIMPLVRPMPSAPVTAMASTIAGNESKVSMTRLMMSSVQPPKKPATSPTGTPIGDRDVTASTLA